MSSDRWLREVVARLVAGTGTVPVLAAFPDPTVCPLFILDVSGDYQLWQHTVWTGDTPVWVCLLARDLTLGYGDAAFCGANNALTAADHIAGPGVRNLTAYVAPDDTTTPAIAGIPGNLTIVGVEDTDSGSYPTTWTCADGIITADSGTFSGSGAHLGVDGKVVHVLSDTQAIAAPGHAGSGGGESLSKLPHWNVNPSVKGCGNVSITNMSMSGATLRDNSTVTLSGVGLSGPTKLDTLGQLDIDNTVCAMTLAIADTAIDYLEATVAPAAADETKSGYVTLTRCGAYGGYQGWAVFLINGALTGATATPLVAFVDSYIPVGSGLLVYNADSVGVESSGFSALTLVDGGPVYSGCTVDYLNTDKAAIGLDVYPEGEVGYGQATSNQGSITSAVDLTGLEAAITVASSRRLRLTSRTAWRSTVAGDIASVAIKDASGHQYTVSRVVCSSTSTNMTLHASVPLTLASSETYHVEGARIGSGTLTMAASTNAPAYLLIEDMGASS